MRAEIGETAFATETVLSLRYEMRLEKELGIDYRPRSIVNFAISALGICRIEIIPLAISRR